MSVDFLSGSLRQQEDDRTGSVAQTYVHTHYETRVRGQYLGSERGRERGGWGHREQDIYMPLLPLSLLPDTTGIFSTMFMRDTV